MTLVFRGIEAGGVDLSEQPAKAPQPAAAVAREALGDISFKNDPAGFAEARARLVELFMRPRADRLQQLVAILREALPEAELAILAPGDGETPVALASVWSGDLPKLSRRVLSELASPGRCVVMNGLNGATLAVAAVTPQREVVAIISARPAGALGNEGLGLLAEAARFLALQWREVERDDATFSGWEVEARHRLEVLLPGSSQAVQVLRAGILAAAHGNEPVLFCGAEGTGRTEAARILAALGPVAGRSVSVFEGRDGEVESIRQVLFGPSAHATLGPEAGGIVGQARGGILIVRFIDRLPMPLQSELAGLISAQRREALSATSIRWIVTCGEDPLALVQQSKLSSALFMLFSQRLLRIPRLGERREDLPLLIAALLQRAASDQRKSIRGISLDCLNVLLGCDFPGEVAQLVGEINRLVTATPEGEMVRCDHLGVGAQPAATGAGDAAPELAKVLASDNLKEIVPRIEQLLIDRVMRRVKGNQSKGAKVLGISRGALIAKLKEYGIPDFRYLRRRRSLG
jgi:DNA-binding NtrC family response regulator